MPLEDSRPELAQRLALPDIAERLVSDWPALQVRIEAWWSDYKAWEDNDDFETAFDDQRMTVRYSKRGLTERLDMKATPPGGGEQREFSKPLKQEKGAAAKWNEKHGVAEKFQVDVSVQGVLRRMNPKNFVPEQGGTSRKADLGLHDLSASLLRAQPIVPQLYNKPDADDRYVFMPLPQEADQVVFQRLNGLAKTLKLRRPELYALVRNYRSQMTRVKLACEHDMGTNFIALAPDDNLNPRFRYGIGPVTKVPKRLDGQDVNELVKDVPNTQELIQARKLAALNYKQILNRALFAVNEITVAYRRHGSPGTVAKFPIFAVWDGAAFKTFKLNVMGAMNTTNPRTISNLGRYT